MQKTVSSDDILDVVRILPDVLFRCYKGDDGKIYWSLNEGGLAEEFGLTTDKIQGLSLDELFPGGASPELHDHFERAFRGERHIFTNEMGDRHFRHFPQAIPDDDGHIKEVVGYIADVTDLVETQRALARANRELDAFVHAASHDLKNPLAAMKNLVELLRKKPDALTGPKGEEIIGRMSNTIRNMNDMIFDYLQLSRARNAKIERDTVDLTALAHDVIQDLESDDGSLEVDWQIQDGLTDDADPGLMRMILQNLLGNALKYSSRQERPQIRFHRVQLEDGPAYCIEDNGVGFSMDDAEPIFEVFHRVHDDFPGTGVGLSTVRRIIEHHEGTVWAESQPGEGAKFYFRLGPV